VTRGLRSERQREAEDHQQAERDEDTPATPSNRDDDTGQGEG
jgi:hypothetical protein